jgi:hypothetical protein
LGLINTGVNARCTGRCCGAAGSGFERMSESYTACWWVPAGHRPSTDEAEERLLHLRSHGPTSTAFTLQQSFPPPDQPSPSTDAPRGDWFCPA